MIWSALIYFCLIFFSSDLVSNEWEHSKFIWNFGIIFQTDKGMRQKPRDYFLAEPVFDKSRYQDLNPGDIVWLKTLFIGDFCKEILPHLNVPIVLLIADGDESFPSQCSQDCDIEALLAHPNIVHIFAQNCDYAGVSQKISRFPIGLDYHTIAYKGSNGGWGEKGTPADQEHKLFEVLSMLKPTYLRKKKAYVDFHLSDTMHAGYQRYLQWGEDRASIFKRLVPTGLIDHGSFMPRSELWKKKGEYAFSISPHGNGLDCHRTWEGLVLGCIVIVKKSCLDSMYEGLPVVIINDWDEITPANLEKWLEQYGDAFTNSSYREKLTNEYWFSKIRTLAQTYKKERQ